MEMSIFNAFYYISETFQIEVIIREYRLNKQDLERAQYLTLKPAYHDFATYESPKSEFAALSRRVIRSADVFPSPSRR
jgi:hypothetical protein